MMSMKNMIFRLVAPAHRIARAAQLLKAEKNSPQFVVPGHFYSPIPDVEQLERRTDSRIAAGDSLQNIRGNEEERDAIEGDIWRYYPQLPFSEKPVPGLRYYYGNDAFSCPDAILLYTMLRRYRPRRVVEIGSGFSSALMLDIDERFLKKTVSFVFIEPFPARLVSLITEQDRRHSIVAEPVQKLSSMDLFESLEKNDVLFIDSTHVSKTGSDVNFIFFEILPRLRAGVLVHFHDIANGFEYPLEWHKKGIHWNESYLLRAFLQFNSRYEVLFFNAQFQALKEDKIAHEIPLYNSERGVSFWLRRLADEPAI
jgi:hypothetical protein